VIGTMGDSTRRYIPAAGYDWLLPLYDPIQRWLLREEAVKLPLVEQAAIRPGHRILDLGCGTGSLTLLTKRLHPDATVVGIDPDPKALARAARKAERWRLAVALELGFSDRLPHPDGSFDAVLSSLVFHHLTRAEKLGTLHEVGRVLRPGGSLHILDFGPPRTRIASVLSHLLHGGEALRDNVEGRIPSLISESGFSRSEEVGVRGIFVATLSYYRGFRPPVGAPDVLEQGDRPHA
jgi:ubiquinone/menaquinone biosynthesis C-methylase UbiE